MKVAVIGCTHGKIDNIFARVDKVEKERNITIDLILCPGDFQAVRNAADLSTIICRPWHRKYGDFQKYYTGAAHARKPIIFIGGNHEPASHSFEMPLGGLAAPNIYFLGHAGVVRFKGLRIAGLSGIYKEDYYETRRFEAPPYPEGKRELHGTYKTKKEDVVRLARMRGKIDFFMSHDWPQGITQWGDCDALLLKKPDFTEDVMNNSLGSKPGMELLNILKPTVWSAAHMHVRFEASVPHNQSQEQSLEVREEQTESPATQFIALDKVRNGNESEWFEVFHVEDGSDLIEQRQEEEAKIELDEEWLATMHTSSLDEGRTTPVTSEEIETVKQLLEQNNVSTEVRLRSDFESRAEPIETELPKFPAVVQDAWNWSRFDRKNMQLFKALNLKAPPLYETF